MNTDPTPIAGSDDYVTIAPHTLEVREGRAPFRFILDGKRFELPALDSADVPLPLLPVFLAVAGGQINNDEDRIRVAGSFIAYLEADHPALWRTLKRQQNALAWVVGLIEQWGAHSGLDPHPPASGR